MKVPNTIKSFQETMSSAKHSIDDLEKVIERSKGSGMGGEYRQEVEIYEKMLKQFGIATLETAGKIPEMLAGDEYERD